MLPSAWNDEVFDKNQGLINIKAFIASMERPSKIATRQQFEAVERRLMSFVENELG
jgi:hypothetical protein